MIKLVKISILLSSLLVLFPHFALCERRGESSAPILRSVSDSELHRNIPRVHAGGYTVDQFASVSRSAEGYQMFLEEPFIPRRFSRKRTVQSSLGSVNIVWSSQVEQRLKKSPKDIVKQTFGHVAQVLNSNPFLLERLAGKPMWNVVLLSRVPKVASSGMLSASRCHSAWTGPPANIVVALDRLALGCSNFRRVVSPLNLSHGLQEVLIHEIGHVLEFQLMGKAFGRRQRWHSEGFATWFEELAAGVVQSDSTQLSVLRRRKKAREAYRSDWKGYLFRGTAADYFRSYAVIAALADSRSVAGLMAVYDRMDRENLTFGSAVEREFSWNEDRLSVETARFLKLEMASP